MKRYTIKCQVQSIRELTSISQKLKDKGIKEEDIDYAFLSQNKEKGLRLKKRSNRGRVAQYGAAIGAIFGLIFFFASPAEVELTYNTRNFSGPVVAFLFYFINSMFFGGLLGFLIGFKSKTTEVIYDEDSKSGKADQEPHIMLAVNCNWDQRESVESVLGTYKSLDVDVEDHKFQAEVGMT